MKTNPKICIPCILSDVKDASLILSGDIAFAEKIEREAKSLLNGVEGKEPSFYITAVHRLLKKKYDVDTPFLERRRECNNICIYLSEKLRNSISETKGFERMIQFLRWAIAANSLDFRKPGAGWNFSVDELETFLRLEFEKGLAVDEANLFWNELRKSEKILYILDNVGEIAFDRLLIEEIKNEKNYSIKAKKIVAVVRSGAMTSDVTIEDAKEVGITEVVDNVISSGSDTLGISFDELSEDLDYELKETDIVVAKGQANYYVFSEPNNRKRVHGSVVCLFSTKCNLVSNIFGLSGKVNILKFV